MMTRPRNISMLALLAFCFSVFGQNAPEQSRRVLDRWTMSQPAIRVYSGGETVLSGQPLMLSAKGDSVFVLSGHELPLGEVLESKVKGWPVVKIDSFYLQRGGNRLSRAHLAKRYYPDETGFRYLLSSLIYEENPGSPLNLEEAFPDSRLLRRTYPRKIFRYSIGISNCGNLVSPAMVRNLESSDLYGPTYLDIYTPVITALDFSFRLFGSLQLGAELYASPYNSVVYFDSWEYNVNYDYGFYNDFHQHVFYLDYIFKPIDRYLLRRWEFMAGGAFLMGNADHRFYYNVHYTVEPWYQDVSVDFEETLPGGMARLSAHYYLFPGMSLYGGIYASFYQKVPFSEMQLPANLTGDVYTLPGIDLNYSSIRFRFGINLYL